VCRLMDVRIRKKFLGNGGGGTNRGRKPGKGETPNRSLAIRNFLFGRGRRKDDERGRRRGSRTI